MTNEALTVPSSLKHPQRLALVASYAPSFINFRFNLIKMLRSAGHEVIAIAPEFDLEVSEKLAEIGVTTETINLARTGLNPLADLKTILAMTKMFRQINPDVVMGYTPKAALYTAMAGYLAKVPRRVPLVTGLGFSFISAQGGKAKLVRCITLMLYRLAFTCSTSAVFQNKDDQAFLASQEALPASLATTLVNGSGVNLEHYAQRPLPPTTNGIRFLMIARLVRYKGVREYTDAVRVIRAKYPAAHFTLIGDCETGPARMSEDEIARALEVVDHVAYTGDVRPFIEACHVYVLPSYLEGMPRSVLEALSIGRAIITTDTNGCRDTVLEGKNGFLVPVGDSQAIASAMQKFLQQPDLIGRMSIASRALCEERFSDEVVNRNMAKGLGLTV